MPRIALLEEAVQVGVAYVRSDMGKPRNPDVYFYEGKQWFTPFGGGSHEWLIDGGKGGRNLDAAIISSGVTPSTHRPWC